MTIRTTNIIILLNVVLLSPSPASEVISGDSEEGDVVSMSGAKSESEGGDDFGICGAKGDGERGDDVGMRGAKGEGEGGDDVGMREAKGAGEGGDDVISGAKFHFGPTCPHPSSPRSALPGQTCSSLASFGGPFPH